MKIELNVSRSFSVTSKKILLQPEKQVHGPSNLWPLSGLELGLQLTGLHKLRFAVGSRQSCGWYELKGVAPLVFSIFITHLIK